jgi:hypothetical protein
MKQSSDQPSTSWNRTYVLILLFNALLILAFYLLRQHFNID